jgi:TRAP-type C4-dicarboxylate transport system permease small subunit
MLKWKVIAWSVLFALILTLVFGLAISDSFNDNITFMKTLGVMFLFILLIFWGLSMTIKENT